MNTKKKNIAKAPTWASQNNVKVMTAWGMNKKSAAKRVKDNTRIANKLKKMGWKFREGVGIADVGRDYYKLSFTKEVGVRGEEIITSTRSHKHPCVHFGFWWTDQGEQEFMVGEMYTFYNYAPTEYGMRPYATFKINNITEHHLPLVNKLFDGLVAALNSQSPSYGN